MRVIDSRVVYRNAYPAIRNEVVSATTICRQRLDGDRSRLLVAFRLGSARMSPDGHIALCASTDDGRTWERIASPLDEAPPAMDGAPRDATVQTSGSQMGASPDGTVILSAARMSGVPPTSPAWDDQTAGLVDADIVTVRGAGDRWDQVVTTDLRRHGDEWAIPCGPPIALGGGRWILPSERHAKAHVPEWLRGYHAFIAISDDDGRSWPGQAATLNDPDRRVAYYDQRIERLPDGRLLTIAWVHDVIDDVTLPARAGWSDDGGSTWSAPHATGIVGGPVNPVLLPDGRILVSYARRTGRAGIRACISNDGGRTFDLADEFVIWDEATRRVSGVPARDDGAGTAAEPLWDSMWTWTFGQPLPTLLADGTVGVTFYASDAIDGAAVRFVRLEV